MCDSIGSKFSICFSQWLSFSHWEKQKLKVDFMEEFTIDLGLQASGRDLTWSQVLLRKILLTVKSCQMMISKSLITQLPTERDALLGREDGQNSQGIYDDLPRAKALNRVSRATLIWILFGLWSAVFLGALDGGWFRDKDQYHPLKFIWNDEGTIVGQCHVLPSEGNDPLNWSHSNSYFTNRELFQSGMGLLSTNFPLITFLAP